MELLLKIIKMKTDFIKDYFEYKELAYSAKTLWECRRLMLPKYLKYRIKLAEVEPNIYEKIISTINET